jgi:tRNA threonylcarbamoyladenosine biosynthesis protein TsaE
MHLVSQSAEDTRAIAAKLAAQWLAELPDRTTALVVALEGELGAGKTTFVQGLAVELGIRELPKSPTFTLAKQYAIPSTPFTLWHLDCYRLEDHRGLAALDMTSVWHNPRALVLIEWAQRVREALPRDHLTVQLAHAGGDHRSITVDEQPKS